MTRLILATSASLACVLGAAVPASAQVGAGLRDFCADRPGKGAATCVLDQGVFQVEVGLVDYARQRDYAVEVESWAVASTLVRYGLTPLLEVQIGVTPYQTDIVTDRLTGGEDRFEGVGDLFFNARQSLLSPDGSGLSAALQGYLTVPTGSDAVRADGVEGGVVLPVSITLTEDWTLALTPGVDVVRDGDGEGSHGAYALAMGVDRGFGAWNLGAEVWVSRDEDPQGGTTQSTFDLTAIWSPSSIPAQIDFGLNFGLNDASPDIEFGVGVARRF